MSHNLERREYYVSVKEEEHFCHRLQCNAPRVESSYGADSHTATCLHVCWNLDVHRRGHGSRCSVGRSVSLDMACCARPIAATMCVKGKGLIHIYPYLSCQVLFSWLSTICARKRRSLIQAIKSCLFRCCAP